MPKKTYIVLLLEEEDTPPVVKRMTKREVIEWVREALITIDQQNRGVLG